MSGRLDPILVVISGTLAACGGLARPGPPSARVTECVLTPPPAATIEYGARAPLATSRRPIVIGVGQPVNIARAPQPANAAERIVFEQVYETLVRVDCTGSVVPGLAESWRRADDGRGWVFTLRPAARFHDGSPVTAKAVGESLTAAAAARRESAQRRTPARVASVTIVSDGVLRVDLVDAAAADARDPASFAAPGLAVAKAASGGRPLGSGSYGIAGATTGAPAGEATVELRPARGARVAQQPIVPAGAALLPLTFRLTRGGDPRNALDAGVDVLVTGDADAIDYALARGSYVTAPLPWDAAYVLFTPVRSEDAVGGSPIPTAALVELARDAVSGVARPSSLDTPWTCPASPARKAQTGRRPRIGFAHNDRVAAGLAERLVALARTDRAGWIGDVMPDARAAMLTAAPLSAAELATSLRDGADAAYVVRVDLDTSMPCPETSGRASLRAVPLVDTRKTAILRTGLEGVTVDAQGTLQFAGARWHTDAEPRR